MPIYLFANINWVTYNFLTTNFGIQLYRSIQDFPLKDTENYSNQDLKKIERWAIDNKIEFNDKNSTVLFITRKRNDNREVNIYLNYKRLDQTEKMKYLGIHLDNKCNFNSHIDQTVAKFHLLTCCLERQS